MKLIAYLVPDDFEDWKMPQRLKENYVRSHTQHFSSRDVKNVEAWKRAGHLMAMAFWRGSGGGE